MSDRFDELWKEHGTEKPSPVDQSGTLLWNLAYCTAQKWFEIGLKEGRKPQAKAKPGPQDQMARDLAKHLGASLNPCRKQIQALVLDGWDLSAIFSMIEEFALPGMAPWDWTKKVLDWEREERKKVQVPDEPKAGYLTEQEMMEASGWTGSLEDWREYHKR